jgi:hypothetical protein
MEAIIGFFMIIGAMFLFNFLTKQYDKEQKRRTEEYKKMYPELEALGKLYKQENFDTKKESLLIMQHHLRCNNYEALKQNFTMAEFHHKKYKEEHLKLFGC